MEKKLSVLLLGAGSMGGAILTAWLKQDLLDVSRSAVVDPSLKPEIMTLCQAHSLPVNPPEDQAWDICVLAFKPQQMASILPGLSWPEMEETLFLSIAAGTTIGTIQNHLKPCVPEAKIVRVMPNLPASIGQGISLLTAGTGVSPEEKAAAEKLMAATGQTLWLDTEEALDSGMAITACGPAYVFLLAEALTEAGEKLGLTPDQARAMAEQMIAGSGALLQRDARDAATLRRAVTSPGGTTAAALAVLDTPAGVRKLVEQALKAAKKRAEELSD